MDISIKDFSLGKSDVGKSPIKIGFILHKSTSESEALQDMEKVVESGECMLDKASSDDVIINLSDKTTWASVSTLHKVQDGADGLYSLIFARCSPSGSDTVNFKLHADFYNPGPNYLSAGDEALPSLYFNFFILFAFAFCVWSWTIYMASSSGTTVSSIHYLMAALVFVKSICLLVESIRLHAIALSGRSETWSIIYYVVTTLRGAMLFTVILLIGSGWSLMKTYLNDREKKIVLAVLSLQVLNNVVLAILEETAPGSQVTMLYTIQYYNNICIYYDS
jgi:hypothetical protein